MTNDLGDPLMIDTRAWLRRACFGCALVVIALIAYVKLAAPSRDAIALYLEEEYGERVFDESPSSFLLDAHFVLMPSGREKARRLAGEAYKIELRRLTECANAAPQCALTSKEFQRLTTLRATMLAAQPSKYP